MRRVLVSMVILACAATATFADDVIAQRRAVMKANGEAAGKLAAILKGAAPYDDATVHAALKTFEDSAQKMPPLFPPDSKSGGDTSALPAIWDNKADFDARFAKLGADAMAAGAAIKDADTFKANVPAVFKSCGGCHELYKVKKG